MGSYHGVIKKESRPYLESLRDDIAARRDHDFFWPTGTQVYCGTQGSGKTISAVRHLLRLKDRYPKAIVVSNIAFTHLQAVEVDEYLTRKDWVESMSSDEVAASEEGIFLASRDYIRFTSMEELAKALTHINNGKYGVIYVVDEIHTYFNALESKNIPMYVFTEISQQRKQRKLIVGTSQLFLRMAKPLREQCDNLVMCNTIMGFLTITKAYDGMTLSQDYDGSLNGNLKKVGWFFHRRNLRNAFDTYQKVVSGKEQFEFDSIQRIEVTGKLSKKLKIK
jgi:hypothetical protein